jgi:hypothetical protein
VEVNGDDVRKVGHGNAIPWNRVEWADEKSRQTISGEGLRVRVKAKDGSLLALGKGPLLQSGQSGPTLVVDTVLG